MTTIKVKISPTIANEWDTRCINDVIPGLPEYDSNGCTLTVSADLAREILANCEFNADAKGGPEYVPSGVRRAYRALAAKLRDFLASIPA